MNPKRLIQVFNNHELGLQERLFRLLVTIGLMGLAMGILVGLVLGESMANTLSLLVVFALAVAITYFSIHFHKIQIGAVLISVLLIYFALPFNFLTSGGIYGGGPIWLMFGVVFVCLVVEKKAKYILIASSFCLYGACYLTAYWNPRIIEFHTTQAAYVDSFFTLVAVTVLVCSMILFQNAMYRKESKIAKEQKKEIEELDIEKNSLLGVPVLSEITKVKELIKTDNLKEKLNDWDNTFKYIRDEKIPELTDSISDADFLIDRKEYKQAIKKIADVEMELRLLKNKTDVLLEEIKLITNSEERNRTLITKLKIVYREQQAKFDRSKKEYGDVAPYIEDEFDSIDKLFADFEKAMDNNDYVSVEKRIASLDDKIDVLGKILLDAPTIVLMATVMVPNKIEEATTYYYRMKRDGYPLDYLNVEYNIKEIKTKIDNIMNNLKQLQMGDAIIELKTFIEYFNGLYNDFDKEKECKDVFKQNVKELGYNIENINKVVRDIYLQIDDIKYNYNLSDEEINKFSLLNKNLERINKDYKILVEQGKMKTFAYSKLVDELDGLSLKLSRLQDDLDYQLRSITSMKDDEYRAKEQLATIEDLLKKSKYRLKSYKIPVIPSSYYIELNEAQDAIREIVKELQKKPIVIKILNIRVDTARDLVFKIYNKTNDMIKLANSAEKIIVYGNRYRSTYEEIDIALSKAEELFKRGKYKESLELSKRSLSFVDKNIE